jgi:DNA-binding transcriptional ArsR family regulator
VGVVAETRRVSRLLRHPLRPRVLAVLREPASASEVARRLGLPRQRVNYHVRELRRAGFLRRAGRRPRRGLLEQRYVATAQAYVLTPEVLGPLGSSPPAAQDRASAAYQMTLLARAQSELARTMRAAGAEGRRVATLSLASDLRFVSAEQRRRFALALQQAIVDVVGRYSAPRSAPGPPAGRPFRLLVACHPAPADGGRVAGEAREPR